MKVLKGYPPNFAALAKVFPIKGKPGILYAWGDKLWNPSGVAVTPWIMAHEMVHGDRQLGMGLEQWWQRYIDSAVFRYDEEILAHQAEWNAYTGPDAARYLDLISARLASPLYGHLLTYYEAREAILNGSGRQ
jgi:hypothetical protein